MGLYVGKVFEQVKRPVVILDAELEHGDLGDDAPRFRTSKDTRPSRGNSSSKRVSIRSVQLLPWKGYFDLIALADEFIIYDECQYTKNDWRNRNQIKTSDGLSSSPFPWDTQAVPGQRDDEAEVANQRWRSDHWKSIFQNYDAPLFSAV